MTTQTRVRQTRKPRLFNVDEYYAMAEAGILRHGERVELLSGVIVRMSPIGSRHAAWVDALANLLIDRIERRAMIRVQNPVRLDSNSEPEPDVTVIRRRGDFYASAHPGPDDVLLLIEVSDTTVAFDREVKLPLYAAAGIPEVWIVDLPSGAVEVYTEPSGETYSLSRTVSVGGTLTPGAFDDVSLTVGQIVPS